MKTLLLAVFGSILFASLTPSAEALTVDTGGTADVGVYISAAIVAGRPAIAYQDATNSDLRYVRASDASGSAWPAPVLVDSANFVGTWASLAVVNGNPAICYYDGSLQAIRYARATDPEGTAWGAPVTVYAGFGNDYSMIVVSGNPAISYGSGTNENLFYVRANDANGASWGAPVEVDGVGNFDEPSMAIVGGQPAIAYSGTGGLWYIRATNAIGSAWGARVKLATGLGDSDNHDCSLKVINGNPAVSYHDEVNQDLKYVRALNTTGTSWRTPVTLDSAGTVGYGTSLAVISGNPAISYVDLSNTALKYVRANNASGDTAAEWGLPVTVDSTGSIGGGPLLEVNGFAAIAYYDITNGDLKYIRATAASGGTLWPADITIEQPVNTLIPDGGSKGYGTVAIGSTADLVFTVKNPNSGSESLTGLAVTIDGLDAAEFSVFAAPAASVAGGASTSFTVRHSPIVQGLKTAALHLASSVEGSKNPFDITLTAASVPEIVVEQPTGAALADGDGRSFPVAATGGTAELVSR